MLESSVPFDVYSIARALACDALKTVAGFDCARLVLSRIDSAHLSYFAHCDPGEFEKLAGDKFGDRMHIFVQANYVNVVFNMDFLQDYIVKYIYSLPEMSLSFAIDEDKLFEPLRLAVFRLHSLSKRQDRSDRLISEAPGIIWRSMTLGAVSPSAREHTLKKLVAQWLSWTYAPVGEKPCPLHAELGARTLYYYSGGMPL